MVSALCATNATTPKPTWTAGCGLAQIAIIALLCHRQPLSLCTEFFAVADSLPWRACPPPRLPSSPAAVADRRALTHEPQPGQFISSASRTSRAADSHWVAESARSLQPSAQVGPSEIDEWTLRSNTGPSLASWPVGNEISCKLHLPTRGMMRHPGSAERSASTATHACRERSNSPAGRTRPRELLFEDRRSGCAPDQPESRAASRQQECAVGPGLGTDRQAAATTGSSCGQEKRARASARAGSRLRSTKNGCSSQKTGLARGISSIAGSSQLMSRGRNSCRRAQTDPACPGAAPAVHLGDDNYSCPRSAPCQARTSF